MTQDEIILIADASGISLYGMGADRAKFIHYLKAFAKLVAEREREACAKICDAFQERDVGMQPAECAGAIRERGD